MFTSPPCLLKNRIHLCRNQISRQMEIKNQTAQESAQSGVVDYAAALRQYHRYGRGRSVKKFCEDEGYDYWKFCKLAREGQSEMDAKIIANKHPVFIEVNPDVPQSSVQRDDR